jgi:hypothetical protein
MLILHHLYNYLQSNLTIPKVNEIIIQSPIPIDKEIESESETDKNKQELKEFLNQFKKK